MHSLDDNTVNKSLCYLACAYKIYCVLLFAFLVCTSFYFNFGEVDQLVLPFPLTGDCHLHSAE